MRFVPASLKGQLILMTLVALLLSQAASFLFILDDHKSRIRHEWFHNMLARVGTAKDVVETTPKELHPKILKAVNTWAIRYSIEPRPFDGPSGKPVTSAIQEQVDKVFGERAGAVKVTVFYPLSEELAIELLFGDLWRDIKHTIFPRNSLIPRPPVRPVYAHVSVPLQSGEWLNAVIMPRGLAPPASPLLVQFATMAGISGLGIIIVLGRLTRPLKKLSRAASALGRGERSEKLEVNGPREIAETIHAFNDMQERLTTFVHDRAKMLAALGHDLRTPITTLRLKAEFIEDDEVREEDPAHPR